MTIYEGAYTSSSPQTSGATPKKVPLSTVDPAYSPATIITSNSIQVVGGGLVRIVGRAQVSTGFGYTVTSRIRINGSGSDYAVGALTTNASTVTTIYYANPGDLIDLWSTDSSSGVGAWDQGVAVTFLHVTPIPVPVLPNQSVMRSSLR